jgi:hypothetical protein
MEGARASGPMTLAMIAMAALAVSVAGCETVLGLGGLTDRAAPAEPQADGGLPDASAEGGDASSVHADGSGMDSSLDASDSGICATGESTCRGGTPQQCVAGAWQSQTPCGGSTPTCSNGVCGTYRSIGGIRSTVPTGGGGVRLASGGFELGTRSCDEAGVCVTGGIVP